MFENHLTICEGTLNILESVYKHSKDSKVFISGSALQFENTGQKIHENAPFEATNPYCIARIQSVYAARYYRNVLGLKVYMGYFFNHDSPLRSEVHVNQKIVRATQRMAARSNEIIELGNLNVRKEFNSNNEKVFEAIFGSGEAYSIKDWVEDCFNLIGKDWQKYVTINKNYKAEYEILVSDPSLIFSLGWKNTTNFKELVKIMMTN